MNFDKIMDVASFRNFLPLDMYSIIILSSKVKRNKKTDLLFNLQLLKIKLDLRLVLQ